jgi:hypothetical protein
VITAQFDVELTARTRVNPSWNIIEPYLWKSGAYLGVTAQNIP